MIRRTIELDIGLNNNEQTNEPKTANANEENCSFCRKYKNQIICLIGVAAVFRSTQNDVQC